MRSAITSNDLILEQTGNAAPGDSAANASRGLSGQPKRSVFIVDSYPIVREGLKSRIRVQEDLAICGEAADCSTALREIQEAVPDILIIENAPDGPNGLNLLQELRKSHPALKILIFSDRDELIYAERALMAQADGYVMKNEAMEVLLRALRVILSNQIYVSERVAARIIQRDIVGVQIGANPGLCSFSDRELEIFRLMGEGESTRQIATKLCISKKTVATHQAHMKEKLFIRTGRELLQQAILYSAQDHSLTA